MDIMWTCLFMATHHMTSDSSRLRILRPHGIYFLTMDCLCSIARTNRAFKRHSLQVKRSNREFDSPNGPQGSSNRGYVLGNEPACHDKGLDVLGLPHEGDGQRAAQRVAVIEACGDLATAAGMHGVLECLNEEPNIRLSIILLRLAVHEMKDLAGAQIHEVNSLPRLHDETEACSYEGA